MVLQRKLRGIFLFDFIGDFKIRYLGRVYYEFYRWIFFLLGFRGGGVLERKGGEFQDFQVVSGLVFRRVQREVLGGIRVFVFIYIIKMNGDFLVVWLSFSLSICITGKIFFFFGGTCRFWFGGWRVFGREDRFLILNIVVQLLESRFVYLGELIKVFQRQWYLSLVFKGLFDMSS